MNKYYNIMVEGDSKFSNARTISLLMLLSIIVCFNVRATSNSMEVVTPPADATIEQWDWLAVDLDTRDAGTRTKLDVAIHRDSIYFRLVDRVLSFYDSPLESFCVDSWIRGVIDGDKVVIDRSPKLKSYKVVGPDSICYDDFKGYRYFSACKDTTYVESLTDQHMHVYWGVYTIDKDIVFDYNSDIKCLNNPDIDIWVSKYKENEEGWASYDSPRLPDPVYADFELMYVPEGPLTPQPPRFHKGKVERDKEDIFILSGNIFSKEGPAMHYYDLYYRIYLDGEPYVRYWYDGTSYTDIYMNYKGRRTRQGVTWASRKVSCDKPFQEAYAVLVYKYADGSEVVSEPAPLVDESGVDEIFRESPEDVDAPVYDLSGRRVRPEGLPPASISATEGNSWYGN